MSPPSQTLTFYLTSSESRAFLVLKSDNQKPRVLCMERRNPSVWSASAVLIPGEYRCRYYCGDDQNVSYYGPAHVDGGIECGMDTLVSIKIPERENSS